MRQKSKSNEANQLLGPLKLHFLLSPNNTNSQTSKGRPSAMVWFELKIALKNLSFSNLVGTVKDKHHIDGNNHRKDAPNKQSDKGDKMIF